MSRKLIESLILSQLRYNYVDFVNAYGLKEGTKSMARIFGNTFLENQQGLEDWYAAQTERGV